MAEDVRHTPLYRDIYKLRQQKIERVFADAKEKHGMRYTQYRGLAQVANWVKLKFAAINLKKLANWKWKRKNPSPGKNQREISSIDFLSALIFFPFEMKKSVLARCPNGLFLQTDTAENTLRCVFLYICKIFSGALHAGISPASCAIGCSLGL